MISKPKCLLRCSEIKIYYKLYRTFSLIINDGHWYCFFRKVLGCCKENVVKDWCLICALQIDSKKAIKYFDKVKKDP